MINWSLKENLISHNLYMERLGDFDFLFFKINFKTFDHGSIFY